MSRKPSTTGRVGLSRATSTASIAMPPPSRIPNRPASVMSASLTSAGGAAGAGDIAEKQLSPRKTSIRKPVMSGTGAEINIQVVVRCRGRSPQELAQTSPMITTTAGALSKAITVETTPSTALLSSFTTASNYGGVNAPSTKTYNFDRVFGPAADQTMVFQEVAEGMLDEVLAGYNCTIFAYGQTGTGKTFTMQGDLELSPLSAPKTEAGIVPRVLHRLFHLLEAAQNTEYTVRCSYVELYNEELRDLLSPDYQPGAAGDRQPMAMGSGGSGQVGGLKLYEDGKKGVMIQGLEEVGARDLKEALALVNKGCQRRQVAETKMNTESSRSHTILTITVHVKETTLASGGDDLLRIGRFNLVDLAGSEAIGRSGATDKRAREAGMINQSLLTLGRVIRSIVDKESHIPYRESKLTRLLQDSLGGRTKTCIVATVSPTRSNMEETLSTLDYALQAKSIRNRPEINAHLTKSGVLKEYLGDIERLKAEVMAAREKNGIYIPEDQWKEMHDQQTRMKSDFDEAVLRASAATVELTTRRKEFELLTSQFLLTTDELEQARDAERALGVMVQEMEAELEVARVKLEEEKFVGQAYVQGERRLHGVAENLKGVAEESVSDVGGLFEKLARKTKVLGANADAATRFGSDMSALSTDLQGGLDKLVSVQARFGEEVQKGVEAFARHTQKHSKRDIASLDASFSAMNGLAAKLTGSVEAGKLDAAETGRALQEVKEEVQSSVRAWARGVGERSEGMVRDLLEHQHQHLITVTSVLDTTADLIDSVISATQTHLASDAAAAARTKRLADQAALTEISRLRAQNVLLARLLTDEKAKTAHLRDELIGNMTNLIVGFTDAQDASWSAVVDTVQAENDLAVEEIDTFRAEVQEHHLEGSRRAGALGEELDKGSSAGRKQREVGRRAMAEVEEGMKGRLGEYGEEMRAEIERQVEIVDDFCERLGETSADAALRADARAVEQAGKLSDVSRSFQATYESSRARLIKDSEGVATFSESLMSAHASSSKTYAKHHTATTSKLDSILSSTATFLTSGISEDVPTGTTPKKKSWAVQTTWERTQPRDILIETHRRRKAAGEVVLIDATGESVAEVEMAGDGGFEKSVASTDSLQSRMTDDSDHPAQISSLPSLDSIDLQPTPHQPQSRIPSNPSAATALPNVYGPTRPPARKMPSGLGASISGKAAARGIVIVGDTVALPPLGETGLNVPRRIRK